MTVADGDAAVLVTFNTDDFPDASTAAYDFTVVHPDDFLLDQLDLYPDTQSRPCVTRHAATPRPP